MDGWMILLVTWPKIAGDQVCRLKLLEESWCLLTVSVDFIITKNSIDSHKSVYLIA